MSTSDHNLLPAPDSAASATVVAIGDETSVKLNELGPMVVNSDGVRK